MKFVINSVLGQRLVHSKEAVADLRKGPRGPGPGAGLSFLFWVKKEEITQRRIAGRARKTKPPPPPFPQLKLVQGVDPATERFWQNCSLLLTPYFSYTLRLVTTLAEEPCS